MADHYYWIFIIFLIIPLIRIVRRYLGKRNLENYAKTPEKNPEMHFETNSSDTIENPQQNLTKPETKDMLVLGEINSGRNNFKKLLKVTGLERDELIPILDDLEERGLMRVEQKSGLLGPKIELYVTDKGFQEYYS